MDNIDNKDNEFILYSQLTKKSIYEFTKNTSKDEGRILLEGIASTSNKDLQGDIISPEAIKSMAQQAPGLNIHGDHQYGLDDVIGAIQKAEVQDGDLHVQFLVTRRHTPIIQDMLDTGVNLGLSIGGFIEDYDYTHEEQIQDIKLAEISLTPMPANWDTYGTVQSKGIVKSTCLTGACHQIMKNMKVKTMNETEQEQAKTETETTEEPQVLSKDDVVSLFNELMAAKEQSIVETVTNNVKSELNSIVEEALNKDKDEDSEPAEEDTEPAPEEAAKNMTDYIDEKFTEIEKRLFKNLEQVKPESPAKKAIKEETNEPEPESHSGMDIETIAKKLASRNDKEALIKQLKQ